MQQREQNNLDNDFAARLVATVAFSGLNQSEFAKAIDVSPGFLSDVLRGLKKPGTDFFIKLKNNIDISLDWLISGQGSMLGHKNINHEVISTIELQVGVVKAAIIDNDQTAHEIVTMLKRDDFNSSFLNPTHEIFLEKLAPNSLDLNLIVDLYNRNIQLIDNKLQRQNTISAAILFFQSAKPSNMLSRLSGESTLPSTSINTQINKSKKSLKATQNNFLVNKKEQNK